MINSEDAIEERKKEIEGLEKLLEETEQDLELMAVLKQKLLGAIEKAKNVKPN
ncbi:hypothetical protein HPY42_04445 [Coprothermobacteraceae bacterium]|nr:hypothetical protein [Coprothermobacteraceae bacterium]